jgi:hypothetical protein
LSKSTPSIELKLGFAAFTLIAVSAGVTTKTLGPNEVVAAGMLTVVRELAVIKAPWPIEVTEFGIVNEVIPAAWNK